MAQFTNINDIYIKLQGLMIYFFKNKSINDMKNNNILTLINVEMMRA